MGVGKGCRESRTMREAREKLDNDVPPLPPCANTGQDLVPGPKVRKHGVPVFGQARVSARHVLRNTSCRHSPTLTLPTR